MNQITINGVTISGNNIVIRNGQVMVDKQVVDTGSDKVINIQVTGNLDNINCDHVNDITVNGNVHSLTTMSGHVEITGQVTGNVGTMSGSVRCGDIGGSVKTMSGNIRKS